MISKSVGILLALGVTSAVSTASTAFAIPITYKTQVVASGTLGGVPFANADLVLTLHSDTADVLPGPPPVSFINAAPMTVSINGGPVATFSDPTAIFSDQAQIVVGFVDLTLGDVFLAMERPAFATYDLKTSIGPTLALTGINPANSVPTSEGLFNLTGAGNSIFTASTVPEPSALAICAVMLAGLIGRGGNILRSAGRPRDEHRGTAP